MVYRPVNWSPLTGGDPAPGDPDGWSHVLHHWDFESTRMSDRARKLGEITATGQLLSVLNVLKVSRSRGRHFLPLLRLPIPMLTQRLVPG